MRTPLHVLGLSLFAAALFGCKDASTDPAHPWRPSAAPSTDLIPNGAVSSFHFVSEGDFGSVNWFTSDQFGNFSFGFLSANEGGSVTAPQVSLFYFIVRFTGGFCCTFISGFGLIPSANLTGGTGMSALTLNTNTATDPNFFVFPAGSGGPISLQWKESSAFEFSSTGTSELRFGNTTFRTIGNSSSSSATVTGSVLGQVIPQGAFGQMGTNHTVSIDVFRQ